METGPATEALRIHSDMPVFDGHNDLPWALWTEAGGDLEAADPRHRLPGYHTDVPRLREGGVGAQFWSVYVPAWTPNPLDATHRQIRLVAEVIARDPENLVAATSTHDVAAAKRQGRIASLMGAEGGHCIENSLDALRGLAEAGVRYLTLTHNDATDWADSATDRPRHGGLTEFGRAVVAEMNRLGMLVDISHVSPDTMRQAIEHSTAPVIASHSSAFALAPHPRNVPDDVLEMVGAGGGVVMVNFYPAFVVESAAHAARAMVDEARELMEDASDEAYVEEEMARRVRRRLNRGTVADVVDHIEHVARVAGTDHVGLGSDFDGIEITPAGLEDVSCYPAITTELLTRGWGEAEIRKVLGGNAERVLEAAERPV